ncbi:hypothetical protein [Streptomyces sp. CAS3]
MRKTMAVPALALLLATAGCGSGDTGKRDDGTPTTCRSLLDAADARFREDARSWSGDKDEVTMFGGSELCRIVVRDQKPHTSALSLRFGASNFPFESPFGAKGGVYDDETGRTLGPDAPPGSGDRNPPARLPDGHPHRRHDPRGPPEVPPPRRRCGGEGVRLRKPSCGAERAMIPGL